MYIQYDLLFAGIILFVMFFLLGASWLTGILGVLMLQAPLWTQIYDRVKSEDPYQHFCLAGEAPMLALYLIVYVGTQLR